MKKILIGLGVVIVLLVVAVLAVPALIPVGVYKNRLLAQIEQATGRQARIDGAFRFAILPRLEFVAGDVSLANAPGQQPSRMVTIGTLSARVELMPLLSGKVVIDSLVLDKPMIALSVDKNGRPNWHFAGTAGSAPPPQAGKPTAGAPGFLQSLSFAEVRLIDGRLRYADARNGRRYELDAVNMTLSLPSPASPLKVEGRLRWHQEDLSYRLAIGKPGALLAGQPSAVEAGIAARPVRLSFRGTLADRPVPKAHGALALDVPSLRRLAAWIRQPLGAAGERLGGLKITGNADIVGATFALRQAALSLGALKGSGELGFDGGRQRPFVQARLNFGAVDLTPYLPPDAAATPGHAAAGAGKAAPAAAGWSPAPIDFAPLRQADADLALSCSGLTLGRTKLGATRLAAALKGGRLVATVNEAALYGGSGRATITVEASGRVPAVALDGSLTGLQLRPFLTIATGVSRLEGIADLSLRVSGSGGSERAIVATLAGSGRFQARNGAIRGINLAAMVRNVEGAFLNPEARTAQKTDFTELGGTFTIRNGVLANSDLAMKSPLLRIAGRGTVNLVQRTVDYRIEPKLVASTIGQGGKSGLAGIMVPVIVTGPWDNLSYRPDLAAAIGGVAKGKMRRQLQQMLRRRGVKIPLPGVLGGAAPGGEPNPTGVLKQLFGR